MSINITVNTTPVTISVSSTALSMNTVPVNVSVSTAVVPFSINAAIPISIGRSSIQYIEIYDKIRGDTNVPVLTTGTIITFSPAYTNDNYMKSFFYCRRIDEDGNEIDISCEFAVIDSSSFLATPSNNGILDWQTTYLGE